MSSQLSAQAITAQTAITRMSVRRCSILPWQRGSSTTPRCRTRLSMDMILSSQPRGHVIIHQARASDRNFMRLTWPKPVVALAISDPAGVGPELAAKLAADPDVRAAASLVVVGDRRGLERGADESALSLG